MFNSYSQILHTIENPPIPIVHELAGGSGLTVNSELLVTGSTYTGNKKSFSIEFLGQGQEVALHFNPRFKFFEHTVVCNTANGKGEWQKEERHSNPIKIGENFQIRIFNYADHYKIIVNDKDLCTFKHRIPASSIVKVKVDGDIKVQKLQLTMTLPQISPSAPHQAPYSAPSPQFGWQPPPYAQPSPPNVPGYNPQQADPGYSAPYPSGGPAPNSYYPSLSQNPNPNVPQGPTPPYEAGDNFGYKH